MEQRLEQQLRQVLAPHLLERLNLLQMTKLELRNLIEQKLQENPFLEKEDESEFEESLEATISQIEELDDTYPFRTERVEETVLPVPEDEPTLHEILIHQAHTRFSDKKAIEIAEYIIYNLDSDGFFKIPVEEVAQIFHVKKEYVREILEKIQMFEPIGIAAKDESDALIIQLRATGKLTPNWEKILSLYFEEFMKGKYSTIARKLGISIEEIESLEKETKKFVLHPGRAWDMPTNYIVPDVIVRKVGEEWRVYHNDAFFPKIRLSPVYKELLSNPKRFSKKDREYLRQKLYEAQAIIQAIEKRRETILGIARYIVQKERDFFEKGSNYFRSLTLEEVAQVVNRDPSTVSRTVRGKYIETPRGIFELSEFFSGGKLKEWTYISYRIKELVANEDKSNPLTDDEIARILKEEGHKIARTTIVKYRKFLGIPSSRERRKS